MVFVCASRDRRRSVYCALERARGEKMVLQKIKEGMKAREAFDKYGIM